MQGAEPLFFLDYLAIGELDPERLVEIVDGIADGCRENGCALLGGETAEMPGFYRRGDYDLAGFIVGVVDRAHGCSMARAIAPGDVLVGLASSGPAHQRLLAGAQDRLREAGLERRRPGVPELERHASAKRCWRPPLLSARRCGPLLGDEACTAWPTSPAAASTGNLPRILPPGTHAMIRLGSWRVPADLPT